LRDVVDSMDKQTLSSRDGGRTQRTVPDRMPWILGNSPGEVWPAETSWQEAAGGGRRVNKSTRQEVDAGRARDSGQEEAG
jgi:hypothetical protein